MPFFTVKENPQLDSDLADFLVKLTVLKCTYF